MKTTRIASMVALSLVIGFGGAATQSLVAPHAAQAADAKKSFTNKEVFTAVQEGQALLQSGKAKDALVKLEAADKIAKKTPYETYVLNLLLMNAYTATNDSSGVERALEAMKGTGEMTPAQVATAEKGLTQVFYQAKNYPKAVEHGQRILKDNPSDMDIQVLVSQAMYLGGNFKGAADQVRSAIRASQTGGKPVSEAQLQLLMSAEYKQENNAGVISALEQLVSTYPKEEYWRDLVRLNQAELKGGPSRTSLDIYMVKFNLGLVKTPEEYAEMAQLALQEGLPGVAKTVMDKGMASGVLGQGAQKDREVRLQTMATTQADADQKNLAKGEAEAAKQPSGDALVKFGEAYSSYGQHDKAIQTIEAGLAKTPQNMDDAKLRLGIAYINAGKRSQALDAFKGITSGSVSAKVARLWTLASAAKKA